MHAMTRASQQRPNHTQGPLGTGQARVFEFKLLPVSKFDPEWVTVSRALENGPEIQRPLSHNEHPKDLTNDHDEMQGCEKSPEIHVWLAQHVFPAPYPPETEREHVLC